LAAQLRKSNEFSWDAILEVAVLFVGIFITMVPALALLESDGARLGVDSAWQYFWATGVLSAFLDNAPTYVSFATLAAGSNNFAPLMIDKPLILQAISVGAVFMGAITYIGNGPNFMVKAIADAAGYQMPSFFGYLLYSGPILLPIFALVTYLFFLP
jgi:Na+/H+ antiporter NhaD/arsenite permease-like protein